MSEIETVRVTLYSTEVWGSVFSYTLPDAIDWFQDLLGKIPPEYREASRFEITREPDYEGGYETEVAIYYDRPLTLEEIEAREAEEAADRARCAKENRARELAMLAALQAKYGEPKPPTDTAPAPASADR